MQRIGRGGGLRPFEDHPRSEAFAARRGGRTARQIPQQHALRHARNARQALRFHDRRSRGGDLRRRDERHSLRRFRAADDRHDGVCLVGRQPLRVVGGRGRVHLGDGRGRRIGPRSQVARAVPRLPQVQPMRRQPSEAGGFAVPHRRAEHRRSLEPLDCRIRRVDGRRGGADDSEGAGDRTGGGQGDPRTHALPAGSGAGLSVVVACVAFALGRREPAHPAGDSDRFEAGERALHPRRTLHRTAPATISV